LAALVGFSAIRQNQRFFLLYALIAIACAGAVLGIVQITGPVQSPAYLYSVTHNGSAVGLFANRNHQAALLAATFPMLRMWSLLPSRDTQQQHFRLWMAFGIGIFLVPMILITGSRAGIGLALLGVLAAYGLAPNTRMEGRATTRGGLIARLVIWLAPPVLAVFAFVLGRALSVERLINPDLLQEELRVQHTPLMLRMTRDFFPFGSGYGSFDPVFRGYEPDAALSTLYFNRAHNDLIELALTGGLLGVLVLAVFLLWWARASISVFVPYRGRSEATLFGRLGGVVIMMLFLASLVDYPLRTPLMAVVFVIACGWLAQARAFSPARAHAKAHSAAG
jgi:O-antigen ligase